MEIQDVWDIKAKGIPVKWGQLDPFQNHSDNTRTNYRENKVQELRKQPYLALHSYFGMC
jgi:hypothetical protein